MVKNVFLPSWKVHRTGSQKNQSYESGLLSFPNPHVCPCQGWLLTETILSGRRVVSHLQSRLRWTELDLWSLLLLLFLSREGWLTYGESYVESSHKFSNPGNTSLQKSMLYFFLFCLYNLIGVGLLIYKVSFDFIICLYLIMSLCVDSYLLIYKVFYLFSNILTLYSYKMLLVQVFWFIKYHLIW